MLFILITWLSQLGFSAVDLLYFAMYNALQYIMHTHILGPNFQEKVFHFNFLIQFSIYLYLDTCFLYYRGILAFIFEHIMVQEILVNK